MPFAGLQGTCRKMLTCLIEVLADTATVVIQKTENARNPKKR